MFPAGQIFFQRLHLVQTVHHEFNVVAGGKPDVTVTVFICDIAYFPYMLGGHETAPARSHGKYLIPGFRNVHQNSGFEDLVIFPFPIVFLDDGWKILPEVPRAKVRDPVFHRFVRIISSQSFLR